MNLKETRIMHAHLATSFEKLLHEQRRSLLEQIATQRGEAAGRVEAANEHLPQPGDSLAQSLTERDLAISIDERESAEIAAIEAALQRIAEGSYGVCIDCGEDIPAARLHAAPEAARCVDCQGSLEKAHPGH